MIVMSIRKRILIITERNIKLLEDDALGGFSWQPRIEVMLSDILGTGKRVHVRRVGVAAGGARRKE